MKKFFNKENYVFTSLDKNAKRQSILASILLIASFICAAFSFMNMLYAFSECIGSITCASFDVAGKDFARSLPLFLLFFMSMWSLLLFHGIYRNVNEEKLIKSLMKNGIAICSFALVNIVYVFIGSLAGVYVSVVEGNPSPLYPLDTVIFSLIFALIGVSAIMYRLNLHKKFECVLPTRGPIVQKGRFVYCFFVAIWTLIVLFSFSDFVYGLFIIDFLHGYVFYSLMFLLVLLLNVALLVVWEFFFNEFSEENRKEFLLPLGIVGTAVSGLVISLYFVALGTNLDAPSNVGFGVLPVAFAASVNIATLLVVFTPLIVSVACLIKGLLVRKAHNKQ